MGHHKGSRALDHVLWKFANSRDLLPPRATSAKAARKQASTRHFKYQGHRRAPTH